MFLATLRLGLTSFGGPIAHIEYQRRAFVVDRRWLSEPAFAELVALCQTLPGPASSQLTIAVGRLRAGWAGALAAWLGFTLPSALLMTAIGLAATQARIPETGPLAGAIRGLEVAAVAIVANALLTMRSRLAPDAPRLLLAAGATVVLLILPAPIAQLSVIAAGALLGRLFLGGVVEPARSDTFAEPGGADAHRASPGRRSEAVVLAAAFVVVVIGSQLLASVTGRPDIGLVAAFVRAGALVFGGGHVVLPLLDAGVVRPGWVTPDQFLAGYGAAQAMPGPLFSFAAYLGAVASVGPGGVAGLRDRHDRDLPARRPAGARRRARPGLAPRPAGDRIGTGRGERDRRRGAGRRPDHARGDVGAHVAPRSRSGRGGRGDADRREGAAARRRGRMRPGHGRGRLSWGRTQVRRTTREGTGPCGVRPAAGPVTGAAAA